MILIKLLFLTYCVYPYILTYNKNDFDRNIGRGYFLFVDYIFFYAYLVLFVFYFFKDYLIFSDFMHHGLYYSFFLESLNRCSRCKAMDSEWWKASEIAPEKVVFVDINGDKNKILKNMYGIDSYPTLLFFKNGIRNVVVLVTVFII
jgi:hypothetical protein